MLGSMSDCCRPPFKIIPYDDNLDFFAAIEEPEALKDIGSTFLGLKFEIVTSGHWIASRIGASEQQREGKYKSHMTFC